MGTNRRRRLHREVLLIYWVAHGLKIVGGAAGGLFAARRIAHATSVMRAEARAGK